MSVLYNQFSIIDITPDFKTKTIVITTNFKVDASTVNLNTVALYDYSAGGQLADYTLHVDGKCVCLILGDYPAPDSRFYLKVTDLYDALNRKLNYSYNDYIIFTNDVVTDVEIISPGYRETFTNEVINIKLKVTNPLEEGNYKVQISSDNVFFKLVTTVSYNATSKEILSSNNDIITVSDASYESGILSFSAIVNYHGQLYIRARAELAENEVGRWSEMSSFTMYNTLTDPMDTTFLDNAITTFDLFPDDFGATGLIELQVNEKSNIVDIADGVLYMEFNKAIKLPDDYEVDADGYVNLGIVTGFRKELK